VCDVSAVRLANQYRDTQWAFSRYEDIRKRLPSATFPASSRQARDLGDVTERFDGFILDAFGVLNIGDTPIDGAIARIAQLRAGGKKLVVLTNGASQTRAQALEKYQALGFDFTAGEIVSSRDIAVSQLDRVMPGALWGAIAAEGDAFSDIDARIGDIMENPELFLQADGFLFLSTARWDETTQARLHQALKTRPRPLVVANPDLVAPREAGLSLEPGAYAHRLADELRLTPVFFGKPYRDAFVVAAERLKGIPANRIAMVGDTLHTDILGGRAAGFGTVLITAHGLFAGHDVNGFIAKSGLTPDFILETT